MVGDGSSQQIGAALRGLGCHLGKVAVVVDTVVLGLGLGEPVLTSLRDSGFTPETAWSTNGEPTVAEARNALAAIRSLTPVAIVGIGGGSALDLAKLVAIAATRDESIEDYSGVRDDIGRALRLVAVPTTAGTGAEATRISMINDDAGKRIISSAALIPDLVALDPQMVLSLPKSVTASTGLDALCHSVEAVLSTDRSTLSIANSHQGLRLVSRSLLRSYERPDDIEARREVLYGAHFAGLGLNAGVILGHSVGYTIANRAHVSHGISCAMALPYCVRYVLPNARPLVAEIAQGVLGRPDTDGLISWITELNRTLEVPNMIAAGIAPGSALEMARECLERYPRPNNPVPMELKRLTTMYSAMIAGEPAVSAIF